MHCGRTVLLPGCLIPSTDRGTRPFTTSWAKFATELPCPRGDTTRNVNQDRTAEIYKAAIENRIEDFPHVDLTRAPAAWTLLGRWNQRFHDCPLLVREIRRIYLSRKDFLLYMRLLLS